MAKPVNFPEADGYYEGDPDAPEGVYGGGRFIPYTPKQKAARLQEAEEAEGGN